MYEPGGERRQTGRCSTDMTTTRLAVAVLLAVGACTPIQSGHVPPSPVATHTFAGGCAGTVLTDAEPPAWALGGFTLAKGTPWTLPWTLSTGGEAVAFVFARHLVAGASPRVDGTNNKVLWVAKGNPANFVVEGIPPGGTLAAVTVNGGPSIVDAPSAGCWTFRMSWGQPARARTTINLDVLPAGTVPPTAGG
jgi:hypothetical protein